MICVYCGRFSDALLCPICSQELESHSFAHLYALRCYTCGRPILDRAYPCSFCMQGIQAYSSYSGLVRALLNQYKVGEERILSKVFAPLYASMLASIGKPLLLPVPASKKGFSDRGFDQMLLIASQLKKSEGYPSLRLFSQKGAGQSKFLSLAEREERHTLSLNPSCKNLLKYSQGGYDFVLLDDIFTTGSTLATCKKLLSDQYGIEAYSMVIAMV